MERFKVTNDFIYLKATDVAKTQIKRITDTFTGNSCICTSKKVKTVLRAAKDCVSRGDYVNTRYTTYAQKCVESLFIWPLLYDNLLKVLKFYYSKRNMPPDLRNLRLTTVSHVVRMVEAA